MDEKEQFFVSESMRHAKSLPFGECLTFVTGMLEAVGKNHPAAQRLRRLRNSLLDSDEQIELIKVGQLKFDLTSPRRDGQR